MTPREASVDLSRRLTFVAYAPIVQISAKHGSGLKELSCSGWRLVIAEGGVLILEPSRCDFKACSCRRC